jgi:hypothetical protein
MKTLCQRRIPAEFDHRVGWIDILTFRRIKTASRAQQSLTAKRKKASFSQPTHHPRVYSRNPSSWSNLPLNLATSVGRLDLSTTERRIARDESMGPFWGAGARFAPAAERADSRGLSRLLRRDRIQRSIFLRSVRIQETSSSTYLSCFSIFSALKNP